MLLTCQKLGTPFVVVLLCTLALSSFVHQVMVIDHAWLPLTRTQAEYLLPSVLAFIGALVVVLPRIRKWAAITHADGPFLLALLAAAAVCAPALVAQNWIRKAATELRAVPNVSALNTLAPRDHALLRRHHVDRHNLGLEAVEYLSGRYDDRSNFDLYFVLPIRGSESDTIAPAQAWLGLKFQYVISNGPGMIDKARAQAFHFRRAQQMLDSMDLDGFEHLENLAADDDHAHYVQATRSSHAFRQDQRTTILRPHAHAFVPPTAGMPLRFAGTCLLSLFSWAFALVFIRPRSAAEAWEHEQGKEEGRWAAYLTWALPHRGFFTTPLLLWANVVVFFIMVISGLGFLSFPARELIPWGANHGPLTWGEGQYWRSFTCLFLHSGAVHLFANMYGLLFAGLYLEPVLGRWRLLLYYTLCGLVASMASLWWHPEVLSVGASGAVFGLYGLLITLILSKAFEHEPAKGLLASMVVFVGYNLLMGLEGNADNAAHIGGLIAGTVLGVLGGRRG